MAAIFGECGIEVVYVGRRGILRSIAGKPAFEEDSGFLEMLYPARRRQKIAGRTRESFEDSFRRRFRDPCTLARTQLNQSHAV